MSELIRRILVVDDDAHKRASYVTTILEDESHGPIRPIVSIARSVVEGRKTLHDALKRGEPFHVLVTDLFLPDYREGLWLIDQLRTIGYIPDDLDVVLLSTQPAAEEPAVDRAIEATAMRWAGANDRALTAVLRPSVDDEAEFRRAVWRGIWDRLEDSYRRTVTAPAARITATRGFITANLQLKQQLARLLEKVAPSDMTVLIIGETGTGKELVAKEVFRHSRRSGGPFVPVDSPKLTEELANSELFGHERGAFTGAIQQRNGAFLRANGGTLFIDEVGDLPLGVQPKLLRCLEEEKVQRVGGSEWLPIDVRVVAATNLDLEQAIKDRVFRGDLYQRLKTVTVTIPPLRERREDVRPCIDHFWRNTDPARSEEWELEAYRFLERQEWPGNVRELKNAIKYLKVVTDPGHTIRASDISAVLTGADCLDGLDDLKSFTERSQHTVFYPVIQQMLVDGAGVSAPVASLCARVWKAHGMLFGNSEECAKKTIRNSWEHHSGLCQTCGKLWKGRFGRSGR